MSRPKITASMIYRLGGASLRHQVVLVAAFLLVMAAGLGAYALYATELPQPSAWITPMNIVAFVGAVFSLGMLREQFLEVKRRLEALEEFNAENLPATYVRKDVLEAGTGVHIHKRDGD